MGEGVGRGEDVQQILTNETKLFSPVISGGVAPFSRISQCEGFHIQPCLYESSVRRGLGCRASLQ